mmetsp:Transcript_11997/g.20268  ORF Transcript_11997/g.20268 Transcript_11997/m.20268 type:complete len:324 (-) Transcript_11997:668-1639(-)
MHVYREMRILLAEGPDEHGGRRRFKEARHVFDAQHMDLRIDELPCKLEVVIERELRLSRVGDISGIRDSCLNHTTRSTYSVHSQLQVVQVVERVEHPKHVHPVFDRHVTEFENRVVRVICVADGICAPQKHLEWDVRYFLPHLYEPFPRALLEEAQAHVESGTAPILDRVHGCQRMCCCRSNGEDVLCANACCKERLMCISPGGICEKESSVLPYCLCKARRPMLFQHLLKSPRGRRVRNCWQQLCHPWCHRPTRTLHSTSVDDEISEVVEYLSTTVLSLGKVKKLRRLADKGRGCLPRLELRVANDVEDEWDVRLDSADASF